MPHSKDMKMEGNYGGKGCMKMERGCEDQCMEEEKACDLPKHV